MILFRNLNDKVKFRLAYKRKFSVLRQYMQIEFNTILAGYPLEFLTVRRGRINACDMRECIIFDTPLDNFVIPATLLNPAVENAVYRIYFSRRTCRSHRIRRIIHALLCIRHVSALQ